MAFSKVSRRSLIFADVERKSTLIAASSIPFSLNTRSMNVLSVLKSVSASVIGKAIRYAAAVVKVDS